jgi:hypothetical protein
MKCSVLLLALLLLPAAFARADVGDDEHARFYQTLKATQPRLYKSGHAFGMKLGLAIQQDTAESVAQMKEAYVDALLALQQFRAESKKLKVPKGGKDLYAAYERFLDHQETTIRSHGLELIRIALDKKLTANDKVQRVQEIVNRFTKEEAETERPLAKALDDFAREHNLKK